MSSVGRQVSNDTGYYIPIADCRTKIYAYNPANAQQFSTAVWTQSTLTSTFVQAAGAGVLRDMGRTVVSASRTFRKVQLLVSSPSAFSTFGVSGFAGTTDGEDYLTGYIELGFSGAGVPTPVAAFGR